LDKNNIDRNPANVGGKGPYIPALSMEQAGKRYDVNTTAEKVRKRDWLIRIVALVLLILLVIMGIGYCATTILNRAGRFTVSLTPNNYGVQLSDTEDFADPTLNLFASPVESMNNITKQWLLNLDGKLGDDPVYPGFADMDRVWGDHNGTNYLAYTFGVRNGGDDEEEAVDYRVRINVVDSYLGADEAIRVMLYQNGEATIYAKPRKSDGRLESFEADKNFIDEATVMEDVRAGLKVGEVDRYTVVVWLEGEDPECVNDIMGGEVKLSMDIEVIGGVSGADSE